MPKGFIELKQNDGQADCKILLNTSRIQQVAEKNGVVSLIFAPFIGDLEVIQLPNYTYNDIICLIQEAEWNM